MVYTLVLEASAERIESSSLSRRTRIWGISSAGRAAALQAVGSGFESCHLHQSFNFLFGIFINIKVALKEAALLLVWIA